MVSELSLSLSLSVARFAREKVKPLVRKMDEESHMEQSVITGMFDQGVSPGISAWREKEANSEEGVFRAHERRGRRERRREGVCLFVAAADGD